MIKFIVSKLLLISLFFFFSICDKSGKIRATEKFFHQVEIDSNILNYSTLPRFKEIIFTYVRLYSSGAYYFNLIANAYDVSNHQMNPFPIILKTNGNPHNLRDRSSSYSAIKIHLAKAILDSNEVDVKGKYIMIPQRYKNAQGQEDDYVSYLVKELEPGGVGALSFSNFTLNPSPPA